MQNENNSVANTPYVLLDVQQRSLQQSLGFSTNLVCHNLDDFFSNWEDQNAISYAQLNNLISAWEKNWIQVL